MNVYSVLRTIAELAEAPYGLRLRRRALTLRPFSVAITAIGRASCVSVLGRTWLLELMFSIRLDMLRCVVVLRMALSMVMALISEATRGRSVSRATRLMVDCSVRVGLGVNYVIVFLVSRVSAVVSRVSRVRSIPFLRQLVMVGV